MSLPGPSWRLAPRVSFFHASSLPVRTRTQQLAHQTRTFTTTPHRRAPEDDKPSPIDPKRPNPFLEQYLRDNPNASNKDGKPQQQEQGMTANNPGDLSASSVFEDDRRAQAQAAQDGQQTEEDAPAKSKEMPSYLAKRDPVHSRGVLDPNPNARERFERKKVIQLVRRGGRLNKTQVIKRTEREHLLKSHELKTSVKKLGALARQISGKRIEDAITQMRFSKKKIAEEVLKHLEAARDEAVVVRGMGLGQVRSEEEVLTQEPQAEAEKVMETARGEGNDKPIEIQLKDGKRHAISDRSTIYIDQAWVGRGKYGKLPDYRARGRIYIMRTPFTSLTILLKEEATRIREHEQREMKRRRKLLEKVWVHLPDRPIQTKSQWYSW